MSTFTGQFSALIKRLRRVADENVQFLTQAQITRFTPRMLPTTTRLVTFRVRYQFPSDAVFFLFVL